MAMTKSARDDLDTLLDKALATRTAPQGVDPRQLAKAVQRMLADVGLPPETQVEITPPKSWKGTKP
jgi:hypothetical protein